MQIKVLEGRREPFNDLEELEAQIKTVWEAASNQDKLHRAIKQSLPRLLAVVNVNKEPIKHLFK